MTLLLDANLVSYVSEVAHPKNRVMLTGVYGATWYVGGLLAAVITYGTQYIDSTWSWRAPSLVRRDATSI